MSARLYDGGGMRILCPCGQPAVLCWLSPAGSLMYYCGACHAGGPPCPLCEGTGRLPVTPPPREEGER